jgi:hypothetical protein
MRPRYSSREQLRSLDAIHLASAQPSRLIFVLS